MQRRTILAIELGHLSNSVVGNDLRRRGVTLSAVSRDEASQPPFSGHRAAPRDTLRADRELRAPHHFARPLTRARRTSTEVANMLAWFIAATIVTAAAAHGGPTIQANTPIRQRAAPRPLTTPPVVSATEAPAGASVLSVNGIKIATPDLGALQAAVARPAGAGPFPVLILLHGAGSRVSTSNGRATSRARVSSPSPDAGSQAAAAPERRQSPRRSRARDSATRIRRVSGSGAARRRPRTRDARATGCARRSHRARRPLPGGWSNAAVPPGRW